MVPIINWVFVLSQIISSNDYNIIVSNILNNEFLFRLNIIIQLCGALLGLILAIALYTIFRRNYKNLAFLAFSLKFIEVILFLFIALIHFVALLILKGEGNFPSIQQQNLYSTIGLFLKNYINITAIPGVFMGLSLMIYSFLFLKSGLIPSKLALFGIVAYVLVVIYDTTSILFPDSINLLFQIIGTSPIFIFQVLIGIWLLASKRINMKN